MTIGAIAIGAGLIGGPQAAAVSVSVFPTITLSWSPTTNPSVEPAWVAVGSDFRAGETRRGRSRELDKFQAGSGRFTLNNRSRTYDPEYNANVLPLRRFKLEATFGGVTYGVLDGYVDSFDQAYVQPREAIAEVSITDAFKVFALAGLPSPWEVEVRASTPDVWYRLGDQAGGTTAADSSGSGLTGTVVGTVTFGAAGLVAQDSDSAISLAGTGDRGITCSTAGASTSGTELSMECWVTPTTLSGSGATDYIVMGISDLTIDHGAFLVVEGNGAGYFSVRTTTGTVQRSNFPAGTITVGQTYHLAGSFGTDFSTVYLNGVAYDPEVSLGGTFQNEPLWVGYIGGYTDGLIGSIDEVAFYHRALSAAEVLAHYNAGKSGVSGALGGQTSGERCEVILDYVGFPATLREIDTGQSILQSTGLSQSALAHLQTVEDSEQGLFFVGKGGQAVFRERHALLNAPSLATFGDGAGELRYADINYDFDDQPIRNVIRRQREGGSIQEARDATSVETFYPRVESTSGLFNDNDDEVRESSHFRLARLKDAALRVTELRIEPRRDPANLFPMVLSLELGDQITVRRRPQGIGSAIDQTVRIEGISHTISASTKTWSTTLQVSPFVYGTPDPGIWDETNWDDSRWVY
jgi:concanavalin A-like lectin/glucanase superfamily protein